MMQLLGSRFATWLTSCEGVEVVVKSMDSAPEEREPSLCWREFLGWRLGTRLGLAVPETQLALDPLWGRVSRQRFIANVRPVTTAEYQRIVTTLRGARILALDFIARNPDRRYANLLVRDDVVFPIDFNVAFDYADDAMTWDELRTCISRWFQIDGITTLATIDIAHLYAEARRAGALLTDAFLEHAVAQIDERFLPRPQRAEILDGMRRRRDALVPALQRWYSETVAPLRRLLPANYMHVDINGDLSTHFACGAQAAGVLAFPCYDVAAASTVDVRISFHHQAAPARPKGELRLTTDRGKLAPSHLLLDGERECVDVQYTAPDETIKVSLRAFLDGYTRGKAHLHLG